MSKLHTICLSSLCVGTLACSVASDVSENSNTATVAATEKDDLRNPGTYNDDWAKTTARYAREFLSSAYAAEIDKLLELDGNFYWPKNGYYDDATIKKVTQLFRDSGFDDYPAKVANHLFAYAKPVQPSKGFFEHEGKYYYTDGETKCRYNSVEDLRCEMHRHADLKVSNVKLTSIRDDIPDGRSDVCEIDENGCGVDGTEIFEIAGVYYYANNNERYFCDYPHAGYLNCELERHPEWRVIYGAPGSVIEGLEYRGTCESKRCWDSNRK